MARKFEVDVLLGPGSLLDIGAALESNERFWGLQFKDELHAHIPPAPQGRLQAHLTIMRGCDHHCTYCIVPTTRGPQVSRSPGTSQCASRSATTPGSAASRMFAAARLIAIGTSMPASRAASTKSK